MKLVRCCSVVLLCGLTASVASAQLCPADLDRSGAATVDELLVAVDGALGQCRADPGCRFGLDEDTRTHGDCSFDGAVLGSLGQPPSCRVEDVGAIFYSDGSTVVVSFPAFDPPLFFGARAIDAEVAMVFGWTHDLNTPTTDIEGLLQMPEQHSTLTLTLENSPFNLKGCPLVRFTGSYDRIIFSGGSAQAQEALEAFRAFSAAKPKPPTIDLDASPH